MSGEKAPQAAEVVLVTGGQGFLGQHIIRMLQDDDNVKEIRVLDIKPFTNRLGFEEKKPLRSYVADVSKMETMTGVPFHGVDCVIHAAAATGFADFPAKSVMELVNVGGTRNVIHLCLASNVGRLVMTSTAHVVIPNTEDPLIWAAEHCDLPPVERGFLFGDYARTKYEAECLVREANGKPLADGSGQLWTVCLRPTLLYGELDPHYVTHALRVAVRHGGTLYRVGWGGERVQTTYAGNAAWAHLLAKDRLKDPAARKDIGGEVVFITDDTPIDNPYSLLEPYLESRQMRLSSMCFPAKVALILVLFLDVLLRLLRPLTGQRLRNPFPHPSALHFIVLVYTFDRLKATLRLRYQPIYDPQQSLANSMAYYKSVPLT